MCPIVQQITRENKGNRLRDAQSVIKMPVKTSKMKDMSPKIELKRVKIREMRSNEEK